MLRKEEKRAVSISENTTVLKDEYYETGLLCKEDKPNLPYNRQLAVQRLQNLKLQRLRTKTYN